MSRTLFWYIFRDLLRIFLLTSAVLAGIMSFGGLLRPLTEHGLSAPQVGRILAYFMPAMQTFALPIAALFATTIVYGRLSADNELTACRATGISYWFLLLPAMVLGLALAIVSLLCLFFVVPIYNLKIERVIFSNLARVVQNKIEQTHQLKLPEHPRLGNVSLFARGARVIAPEPDRPDEQVVVLDGPMFATSDDRPDNRMRVPAEFFMASSATAYLRDRRDHIELTAVLTDGVRFRRDPSAGDRASGGVGSMTFGPVALESPIRENTKFMDIRRLRELRENPERSRRVRKLLVKFTQRQQELRVLTEARDALNSRGEWRIASPDGVYVLRRGGRPAALVGGELRLASASPTAREVRLDRLLAGQLAATDEAQFIAVQVQADGPSRRVLVDLRLQDVLLDSAQGRVERGGLTRLLSMPMTPQLLELGQRSAAQLMQSHSLTAAEQRELRRALDRITADILSEWHARASFGLSCLVLVVVGCALGMLFRSGNFLSAFALSVVPALMTVALIVTGQNIGEGSYSALGLGLAFIWSGNAAAVVLAVVLFWRLQRT